MVADGEGMKRGHREGQQRRWALGAPAWCEQDASQAQGDKRGLVPPHPMLAAVPEQQDMGNIHPTGGVRSKAVK